MLTPERAREIHEKQKQFPYWGNYRKFMTDDEFAAVIALFHAHPNGNITVAAIVQIIAASDTQQSIAAPENDVLPSTCGQHRS